MKPDKQHQADLAAALDQQESGLRARLAIRDYQSPDYLASEVLVSLIRLRHGAPEGVGAAIVEVLNSRLTSLAGSFFAKHGKPRQGESIVEEAVNAVWVAVLAAQEPVGDSFAEMRFLPFVSARLTDLVRRAIVRDRNTVATAELAPIGQDGEITSFEESIPIDGEDQPEKEFERKRLMTRLAADMAALSKKERIAVYFRLECQFEWRRIAELMDCSIPTARKHYKDGYARLNKTMDGQK